MNHLSLVRFCAKHADAEIQLLLSESAPPADMDRIGVFRAHASKHAKKVGVQQVSLLCFVWNLQSGSNT